MGQRLITSTNGKPRNDECYTPAWIFDGLGVRFDLDVCAPIGGTGLVPSDKYYSEQDDGLTSPWFGLVWMNPPYSKPTPWIDKFIEHGNGLCLVPTSKSKWLTKIWNAADAVALMPPNLKFVSNGKDLQIMFQTIMFAMGDDAVSALKRLNTSRVR
jgi:hypothetical protein